MKVHIIAALSRDRVIGVDGQIPWHLPDDLRRFKRLTMGHPVIMGHKTWRSIGRALPGRTNIVLTRDESVDLKTATVVHGFEAALEAARAAVGGEDAFVIGGGEVYRRTIGIANVMHLTHVDMEVDVDGAATFPEWGDEWVEAWREEAVAPDVGLAYAFARYERRG